MIGTSLEIHFNRRFSVVAEALYNRSGYTHTSTRFFTPTWGSFTSEKHVVDRWQFPVLVRYSLAEWHGMYPFAAAGVSFHYTQDSTQSRLEGAVNPPFSFIGAGSGPDLRVPTSSTGAGGTLALGTAFGSRKVRPTVEYRYTRWAGRSIAASPLEPGGFPGVGPPTIYSNKNQSELLAGLMFDLADDNRQTGNGGANSAPHRLAFGLKAGGPLTAALDAGPPGMPGGVFGRCERCGTQRTVPYLIGPAITFRLWRTVSLSADLLYSRADYNATFTSFSVSSTSLLFETKNKVDRLELPLLFKFSMAGRGPIHPFVAAGASVQYNRIARLSGLSGFRSAFSGTGLRPAPPRSAQHSFVAGPTGAAGIEIGSKRLRPILEFRYTRWMEPAVLADAFGAAVTIPPLATVRSNQNQAQFLLGLMF